MAASSVDPRDFGAAGDGRTDDTAALNGAIGEVNRAGGGRLRLSFGEYLISSPLVPLAGSVLVDGVGFGSALTVAAGFTGPSIFSVPCGADHVTFRNLGVIGGAARSAADNPRCAFATVVGAQQVRFLDIDARSLNGYVVDASGHSRGLQGLTIMNLYGRDCGYGVHLQGVSASNHAVQAHLTNISFQQTSLGDNIFLEDANDVQVTSVNCSIYGRRRQAAANLHIRGGSSIFVSNLDVGAYPKTPAATPCVLIEDSAETSASTVQLTNGIVQGGATGIEVLGGKELALTNLKVARSGLHGLRIAAGVRDAAVRDCIFSGNGVNNSAATPAYDVLLETDGIVRLAGNLVASPRGTTSGTVTAAGAHRDPGNRAVWTDNHFGGRGHTPSTAFDGPPRDVRPAVV